MRYESVPVPFIRHGNRRALTMQQIATDPYLREFVERFASSFEYDPHTQCLVFIEPDEPTKHSLTH